MALSELVAAEVRAESARRRITGRELSRRVDVPFTTLARWLRGKSPIPLDELDSIASALGLDVVTLIASAKQQRPDPIGPDLGRLPQLDSNQQPAGYAAPESAVWGMAA